MSVLDDPIRVLHVDDDVEYVDLAATLLEREHERLDVVSATGGTEALAVLDEEPVDCIVSDYDMPEMDGLALLEAVRDRDDRADLPFILFTGKGSEQVASAAISAGVTDYLQKAGGADRYALLANRIENVVEGYRSRNALAERTRRLETLVSNLPGVVYRCRNEPAWPMEFVGGECEELTGYEAAAVERDEVEWGEDVIHPADAEETWEAVQRALEGREPFEVTYRIRTADDDLKWVWERGRGIFAADELEALEGFITDITDRIERERALEAERDRVRTLFENSTDAIAYCEYEDDGPIVRDVNPAFEETFGCDGEAVVGEHIDDVVEPTDEAEARAINRRTREGERVATTVHRKTADGSRAFRLLSVPLRPGETGEQSYAVYTAVDDRSPARAPDRDGAEDA